jgi:hypothetical protein
MPVDGGSATKVIDSVHGRLFESTQSGMFFASGPLSNELRFLDFASGVVKTVAALGTRGSAKGLAISPDGRWAVYPRSEHTGTNLMQVENFR